MGMRLAESYFSPDQLPIHYYSRQNLPSLDSSSRVTTIEKQTHSFRQILSSLLRELSLGYQEVKMYNGVNEEVGSVRERRNRNSRAGVNGVNMEKYRCNMRILTYDRELRIRLRYMVKNLVEEVGAQLQELGQSLGGSGRARAERLYRAWLRTVGIPGVPTIDVAGEEHQTSHTL